METRWQQRYSNYKKAINQLSRFLERKSLNELEEQGLIQAFEYTFELAWKTLQDFLEEESGYLELKGPRPVLKQAFKDGIIGTGEIWMEMLNDRNRSVHTYDEDIAREIINAIVHNYFPLLKQLDNYFSFRL
jgi:nucleotidyltransferase substrate binding protein (TIGR01987 family)